MRIDAPLVAFDLRTNLTAWWADGYGPGELDRCMRTDSGWRGVEKEIDEGLPDARLQGRRLRRSTLYWVSRDLTELSRVAADTFPAIPLRREEVPDTDGLLVFAAALALNQSEAEGDIMCIAVQWSIDEHDRLNVVPYLSPEDWLNVAPLREFFGEEILKVIASLETMGSPIVPVESASVAFDAVPAEHHLFLRGLRSVWALARQRLAVTESHAMDRASRRRATRAAIEFPDVQIIKLRRARQTIEVQDSDEVAYPVDWSHRWIVGAHWRNQWMPGSQSHEPRWIAPYVKGPDDKPLIADRMYAIVR